MLYHSKGRSFYRLAIITIILVIVSLLVDYSLALLLALLLVPFRSKIMDYTYEILVEEEVEGRVMVVVWDGVRKKVGMRIWQECVVYEHVTMWRVEMWVCGVSKDGLQLLAKMETMEEALRLRDKLNEELAK